MKSRWVLRKGNRADYLVKSPRRAAPSGRLKQSGNLDGFGPDADVNQAHAGPALPQSLSPNDPADYAQKNERPARLFPSLAIGRTGTWS
jgi:hypothetical protein